MASKRIRKTRVEASLHEKPSRQWRCRDCGRSFGRPSQSHTCLPALTLNEYLARQPPAHAAIYGAALERLKRLGEIDIDPVGVGIMVKRTRTFCELRPKRRGVELSFKLSHKFADRRIHRSFQSSPNRICYFVMLEEPEDVDDTLGGWLADAYRQSPA